MAWARPLRHSVVVSLFWRVVANNAGGLVVAALVLALSPATVSPTLTVAEGAVLTVGTLALIALNIVLLRRVFEPLERLAAVMRRIDPLDRAAGSSSSNPWRRWRTSIARSTRCSIGSRRRGSSRRRSGSFRRRRAEGVEQVREIACGLRPQALDEFGLRSALVTLAAGFSERSRLQVRHAVSRELPQLAPEQDLAIYRVAQESLTNAARHAGATTVELSLRPLNGSVVLEVRDDGRGITDAQVSGLGVGLGGMRERALLVGGRLTVRRCAEGGTEVRLEVPA